MATPKQLRQMHTILTGMGVTDRAQRLELVNEWLDGQGRGRVATSKDLAEYEAAMLIDWLQTTFTTEMPE
jgi:hypothetical protein